MKPSIIVYLQLFAVLHHLTKEEKSSDSTGPIVEGFLSSHFASIGIGVQERSLLLKYILIPKKVPNIELTLSDNMLKSSVQEAYDLLCEYFGPTKTDEIFQRAINKVSRSNDAKHYSPKNFL